MDGLRQKRRRRRREKERSENDNACRRQPCTPRSLATPTSQVPAPGPSLRGGVLLTCCLALCPLLIGLVGPYRVLRSQRNTTESAQHQRSRGSPTVDQWTTRAEFGKTGGLAAPPRTGACPSRCRTRDKSRVRCTRNARVWARRQSHASRNFAVTASFRRVRMISIRNIAEAMARGALL